jgi:hypothetical protein
VPERNRRVVEDRRQRFLQPRPPQLERRLLDGSREHAKRRVAQLDAVRRLRRRDRLAFDLDDGLRRQLTLAGGDDLRQTRAVA